MDKEFLKNSSRSVTLNITGGKIDSYREKEQTTGTVRVYADGKIGVAGCLGEPDEEKLTAQAEKALALGIPYVSALDGALERTQDNSAEIVSEKELIPAMQAMLDKVGEACPGFAVSNKISLSWESGEYRNSNGRNLKSSGSALDISLLFQSRGSGNLMDAFYQYSGRTFDPEKVVAGCKTVYDAYNTPAELEEGEWPVIISAGELLGQAISHFVGEMYVAGASLLSGKLGEKCFSEKLSFGDDRNAATNLGSFFFDDEGSVLPEDRGLLIRQGKLESLLTTKNSAAQLGLPAAGTAGAAYDGVPTLTIQGLYVARTAEDIREIVPGKAVYVMSASGGDYTPSGHFATPVQMAYLVEDGKLVGRLPELNISGDFFDILGKNYLGAIPNTLVNCCPDSLMVTKLQVTK